MPTPARRRPPRTAATLALSLCALSLAGCSKKWQLMPTPLVHQHIGAEAFDKLSPGQISQDIEIFYATDRPAGGTPEAREYGNGISEKLQLGVAGVRLGEPGLHWQDVVDLSILRERKTEVPLDLTATRELDALPDSDGAAFAAAVDRRLADCRFDDITIYVHGARSTFLRSAVQGAQFFHFMVRETAFVSYSWPSTGKFISYGKDVEFAARSAEHFADLVEFLAAGTRARRINVLAYSAGGQVVAPGLALLRDRHPGESARDVRRKLRLGDIYFAAADVGLRAFCTEYLPAFSDIVDNVTLTFHKKDSVLKFAQRSHDGESRLGRPDSGELDEAEIRWLEELAAEKKLDVLDMGYSTADRPVDFKAHGHWYLNEWVSSDAILQFLFHDDPARRGLRKRPGTEVWYFPPDYPEVLRELVREEQERRAARGQGGSAGTPGR